MAEIVLRVRLVSGDRLDLAYDDPAVPHEEELIDHVGTTLARDDGVLRCRHGDRLVLLFARGVATAEIEPRGAVL